MAWSVTIVHMELGEPQPPFRCACGVCSCLGYIFGAIRAWHPVDLGKALPHSLPTCTTLKLPLQFTDYRGAMDADDKNWGSQGEGLQKTEQKEHSGLPPQSSLALIYWGGRELL